MSRRHVVDVLAEHRTVISLSGLDLGRAVEISVPGRMAEIVRGELVDVKHGVGVPSHIGIKRPDGIWVWRRVEPGLQVKFNDS